MPAAIPREQINAMAARILELLGRRAPLTFNAIVAELETTSTTTVQRGLARLLEEGRVTASQEQFTIPVVNQFGEWSTEFRATGYRLATKEQP